MKDLFGSWPKVKEDDDELLTDKVSGMYEEKLT